MTHRRDKLALGKPLLTDPDKRAAGNRLPETQNRMETKDPTQGIRDWLQDCTANLEDLQKHVPAKISEAANSDSEVSLKVVDK